jgi:hypothetical protein
MKNGILRSVVAIVVLATSCLVGRSFDKQEFYIDGIHYVTTGDNTVGINMTYAESQNSPQIPLDADGYLYIPESVTYEGKQYTVKQVNCFCNYDNIIGLILPATVESIEELSDCKNLKVLDLGGTVDIGENGVINMPNLKELRVQTKQPIITFEWAFIDLGFTSWKQPANLYVGDTSNTHWDNCEYIDLSESIKSLGVHSWNELPKVKEIVMSPRFDGQYFDCFNNTPELEKLTLPENYDDCVDNGPLFDNFFNYAPKLAEIYSPSPTPPTFKYDASDAVTIGKESVDLENCKVYVPIGAKETYQASPSWSGFKNIIETEFAGLKNVTPNKASSLREDIKVVGNAITSISGKSITVFNTSGEQISSTSLQPGVYFVAADGACIKVVVR